MLSEQSQTCYHCAGPLPAGAHPQVALAGVRRDFCCTGCQAIAQTIHGQGLDAFYARRASPGEKPAEDAGAVLQAYDDPVLRDRFAREVSEGVREVTLQLEKIRCAACMWLNEQHLKRLPGVVEAEVNYVTQRARVRFAASCRLSRVLQAVRDIGYAAWPYEPSAAREAARRARQRLLMRLGVALLGMMQVMMYAWPTYTDAADLLREHAVLLGWASFALTLPVMLYSAAPIFSAAWGSLRHFATTRTLGMDVPVALALALAFVAGTLNLARGAGDTYFDSITMFVAFLLGARHIELAARTDAGSGAEALSRHLPATCERLVNYPACTTSEIVPVVKLAADEVLRVAPGEAIPVDGYVEDGHSTVDEALLSGESRPVRKHAGDAVFAGSFNLASPLLIRVQASGAGTRIASIADALDRALQDKPKIAQLSERWAARFVLVLLALAAGTALAWAGSGQAWVHAVAVLVVSCPCALSLATPAAMAAAQGAMTRRGVLIVRGHALETLAHATDLVLDKTGTLTTGQLAVAEITLHRAGMREADVIAVAAGLEAGQKHPIARALQQHAHALSITPQAFASQPRGVLGKGVEAQAYRLGAATWLGVQEAVLPEGTSAIYLADAQGLIAQITLHDEMRAGADTLVAAAKAQGLTVRVLSGDSAPSVRSWCEQLGIAQWRANCSPEDKLASIRALQAAGCIVWAVGDGVNDGPQLAQADVSVAIASGAPLAQVGADGALTVESLAVLADMLHHARKTQRVIRQNLAWAFVYNLVAIPAAAAGAIGPWGAAIGMSLSSLLVTLNAWRLRRC